MMNTWVKQIGYPIIDARVIDSKIKLAQKRLLLEDDKGKEGSWIIPLSIRMEDKVVTK